MNVLLIGSGGREHALAWKLSASPLLTKLYCAPGNGGIAEVAECVPIAVADHTAVIRFCKDNAIDLVVVGPEAPLVAGLVDDLTTAGIKCFGPNAGGGAARRLEGFHQGSVRRVRYSDRGLWPLHGCRQRQGVSGRAKAAHRRQGRRARRRQGRHHRDDARRGRGGDRRLLCRRLRQGRQRGRHRGISRRRGGELLRARRRQARAGARRRAGSQARRRRRHRPQHGRHGRLLAGRRHDARA